MFQNDNFPRGLYIEMESFGIRGYQCLSEYVIPYSIACYSDGILSLQTYSSTSHLNSVLVH